ncbi:MAG: hypothetical protein E4H27_01605, partial [Anaerolineales bacterium]
MEEIESSPTFENISQRVVYSYLRQLVQSRSVMPDTILADEQPAVLDSHKALLTFFQAFYQHAFDHPEQFG